MRLETKTYLYEIKQACRLIAEFTADRTFDDYSTNPLLRSGVERQLEIIGEAINMLSRVDPDVAQRIPEHKKMISMRNRLIHGYSTVNDDIVWDAVQHDLRELMRHVEGLLGEG